MDTTDEQRFTDLYRQHYSALDAYVRRRIHADQVSDVLAEVFLVAWRRLDELPEPTALPWLYGVARHTLSNAYRSEERRFRIFEALASQPIRNSCDHGEAIVQTASLAVAFGTLSDADQEVLRLTLWEDLPASQAAKVLGCNVGTFQVRLHRSRKRLRKALASTSVDESDVRFTTAPQTGGRSWGGADA
ncbi:sigma-70 family RNA polymerase sigma factor [Streptomyces sp. NBC_01460]|uniref:RNA polymerase sigma factor n=1 Tax=Streptomyces sp. NBC_01460 TaxID=2903875 RepID=UPI002E320C2D|nr:sigma-70 family RNA polymerase sigma factor [Streptomyces sp. NBC_01460]